MRKYTGKAIVKLTGETVEIPYLGTVGANDHLASFSTTKKKFGEHVEAGLYSTLATGCGYYHYDGENWESVYNNSVYDFLFEEPSLEEYSYHKDGYYYV